MYKMSKDTEQKILELFKTTMTMEQIAATVGVGERAVRSALTRNNIPTRMSGRRKPRTFTQQEIDLIIKYSNEYKSQTWIAQQLGCHQIVISRVLRQHKPGFKPIGGLWKGGRINTSGGYIAVYVEPTHEYNTMRSRSGYVPEHRLVMAKSLGRPLLKTESVHHIDGNRQNNELSNLQLRNGQHGKGVAFVCKSCGSCNVVPTKIKEDLCRP